MPDFMKRRSEVSTETIEKYLHNLYAVQPDFLYSVSRDFIRNCRTPMLVLPDDVPGPFTARRSRELSSRRFLPIYGHNTVQSGEAPDIVRPRDPISL